MKRLRAYCELVRLPNSFTAMADILAGYWLAGGGIAWTASLAWLLLASACLYSSGIAFNDLHDVETDRRERPARPLPSGRVPVGAARGLAIALMVGGLLAAWAAGLPEASRLPRTAPIAAALAGAILAYDLLLKETFLGPITMGACRSLNFLLAVAAAPIDDGLVLRPMLLVAIGIFVYVASLTSFGRHEAAPSGRGRLMAGGLGIAAALCVVGSVSIVRSAYADFTVVLWLALAIHLGRVILRAIRDPGPARVQYAMKTFLIGIIALDAVMASSTGGWQAGLIVLGLFLPALTLGRWLYST